MIVLTKTQLKSLSEISADIGQVFFASAVVTPLVSGLEAEKLPVILSGLVGSFTFWLLSVLFVKEAKS